MAPRRSAPPTREKPAPKRREPAQTRAVLTRELIFEAALKLLEAEGLDGFTTNRLAQVSGYSVGTIYQYFDDKRAVLVALGEREAERALAALRGGLATQARSLAAAGAEDRIRGALRVALGAFGGRLKARRLLVQAALRAGHTDILDRPVNTIVALLQSPGIDTADATRRVLQAEEAFVLAHAVMGAIRTALLREPALLKRAAFEDALVRLVAGFLYGPRAGA
jgi:AcrR family transcriptional regulator